MNRSSRLILPTAIATALLLLSACSGEPATSTVTLLQTPAATGSMGSNIATGADGTLVLSWIEPEDDGHALRFSRLADDAWSPPQTISSGDNWFVNWADFPSVVPVSGNTWAAHWLVSQPAGGYAYDVHVALSADGGKTWSAPFVPHTDNTPTEHGFVSLFADTGGVGILWLDGRKMINEYDDNDVAASGMTLRTATFGADTLPVRESLIDDLVCDCCQTDIALSADGPVAIYRDRTTAETRDIHVSRREFGEWQDGIPVGNDGWEMPACPVNGPVINARGSAVGVVWFTAANDRPVVKAAFSDDSARTFGDPLEISEQNALGHVGAVMLPGGDMIVAWHGSMPGGKAELLMRRVSPTAQFSEVYRLAEAADVFAFSVPQIGLAGQNLVVAWTTSVDNVYGVQTARVPLSVLRWQLQR